MILAYGGNVITYGGHAFTPVDKAPEPYSVLNVRNAGTMNLSAYTYDSAGAYVGSAVVAPGSDRDMSLPSSGKFLVSGERPTGVHLNFFNTGISGKVTGWTYSPIGNYMSGIVTGSSSKVSDWTSENLFTMSAHTEGSGTAYSSDGSGPFFISMSATTGYYPSSVLSARNSQYSAIVPSGLYGKYSSRARLTARRSGLMLSSTAQIGMSGGAGIRAFRSITLTGGGSKTGSAGWSSGSNYVSSLSGYLVIPYTSFRFDRETNAVYEPIGDLEFSAFYR